MVRILLISINYCAHIFHFSLYITYPQEEDLHNKMNEDRRRTNLEKKLQFLEKEIDIKEKARGGVEQLAKVYQEQPDFVDEKGADDVNRELAEVCVCVCLYVIMCMS